MLKWMRDHKGYTYFIISVIVSAVIILVENVLGFAIKIFSFGGGEIIIHITLGGNIIGEFHPLCEFAGPSAGHSDTVTFNLFLFLIAYALRFLIIIPLTNLFLLLTSGLLPKELWGVVECKVIVIEAFDLDSQPGWCKAVLKDAKGKEHILTDKLPVMGLELDEIPKLPLEKYIRAEVINNLKESVEIRTEDGIDDQDGKNRFIVPKSVIREIGKN